jgi:hypothetical protein
VIPALFLARILVLLLTSVIISNLLNGLELLLTKNVFKTDVVLEVI